MRIFSPLALILAVAIFGVFLNTFKFGETKQTCNKSFFGTYCYTSTANPSLSLEQTVGFLVTTYAVVACVAYMYERIRELEAWNLDHQANLNHWRNYTQREIQMRETRIANLQNELITRNQLYANLEHELELTRDRLFAELGMAMDHAEALEMDIFLANYQWDT
jgi:hypothetical protein